MKYGCNALILAALCSAPSALMGQSVVGNVFASDAAVTGSVMVVSGGTQVLSGSQVAAGVSTAVLRLARGGEIRICPGTSVAIAASVNGSKLMLSLNTGSMETHYDLGETLDGLVTPDFRMQLIGPGAFHFAVAANEKGDMCIRSLPGSTAAVIVSEVMGDGTYQVKPGDDVVFRDGQVSGATRGTTGSCGCPAPPPVPVQSAANPKPNVSANNLTPPPVQVAAAEPQLHVEVDAPFVFNAEAATEDPSYGVANLKTRGTGDIALQLQPTVLPPAAVEKTPPRAVATAPKKKATSGGFFKKVGSFFGRIFKG
ncbi:MAG TPA: hypothetical protein VN622_09895 [Clostridia bacterium]|nr:hypothetical protein [Clostridia bacterium]